MLCPCSYVHAVVMSMTWLCYKGLLAKPVPVMQTVLSLKFLNTYHCYTNQLNSSVAVLSLKLLKFEMTLPVKIPSASLISPFRSRLNTFLYGISLPHHFHIIRSKHKTCILKKKIPSFGLFTSQCFLRC